MWPVNREVASFFANRVALLERDYCILNKIQRFMASLESLERVPSVGSDHSERDHCIWKTPPSRLLPSCTKVYTCMCVGLHGMPEKSIIEI